MKKGGKLHIGGYTKPLAAVTERKGVCGLVPSSCPFVELEAAGVRLYVAGREEDADVEDVCADG